MKNKIRLLLDYGCNPIWVYDHNGKFIGNQTYFEFKKYPDLKIASEEIQKIYDALFINNDKLFEYNGFSSEEERLLFSEKIEKLAATLIHYFGDRYIISYEVQF